MIMVNNMYLTETFFLHSDFSIWSTSILCQQDKLHKKVCIKKEMQIKSNFTDDVS